MNTPRSLVIVWAVLVALSLASFAGEAARSLHPGPAGLLGIALVKALLVGARFMDLRHAHTAWRLSFAGAVSLILGGLWLLRRFAS